MPAPAGIDEMARLDPNRATPEGEARVRRRFGLPLSVLGYALLKDRDRPISARYAQLAISLSVVAIVSADQKPL